MSARWLWLGYTLTDEGLSFVQPAATMRPCESDLTNQESSFFRIFTGIKRFEFQDGALILRTADGRAIGAYRG